MSTRAPPPVKYHDALKVIDAAVRLMTVDEVIALAEKVRAKNAEAFT